MGTRMTEQECRTMVEQYLGWLRQELLAQPVDHGCELTTPFLDRHRDQLQIYATRQNGCVILSDAGYAVSELRTAGIEIENTPGKAAIETLLKGFGVALRNRELVVEASPENIGEQMNSLVQAMLSLDDLSRLASLDTKAPPRGQAVLPIFGYREESTRLPAISSSEFEQGVRHFFAEKGIECIAAPQLRGHSNFEYSVDFLIPETKHAPVRYIQLVANPSKRSTKDVLLMVLDTREARSADSRFLVFLNDVRRKVDTDLLEPLAAYDVTPVRWTEREEYLEQLAA